jgi:alpha-D-ribose 1-methylphosphonate 5-triphosphate synthase subunit PhnH
MTGVLTPGFADTVGDAQACFRLVLDAMARPGRVQEVRGIAAPAPLCNAAAAVVLTLLDHETPLWLDPAAEAAGAWIAFHTGAPVTGDPAGAMFALLTAPGPSWPGLSGPPVEAGAGGGGPDKPGHDGRESLRVSCLPMGTDEAPETSATVILQVASLTSGRDFLLEGPGLRAPALLTVDGLPSDFADTWQRNHVLFPRGIDVILCAGDRLAALPRSVSVREA